MHRQQQPESSTLLLLTEKGDIVELKCPIAVFCNQAIGDAPAYSTLHVTEVKSTPDARLVFVIDEQDYDHSGFHFVRDVLRKMSEITWHPH